MESKLAFSDFITIAVIVVVAILGVQWYQKSKGKGCGCGPAPVKAPGEPAVNLNRRVGMRSCA